MAWTESRSRDEWLAEVKRRGERLRRRRQFTVAVVAALALVLPASALAGFLTADPGIEQQLAVAGPAPATGLAPDTGALEAATPLLAADEPPATSTTTTLIEPVVRPPAAGGGGSVASSSASTIPANDNPVVARSTTTTVAEGSARATSAGGPSTLAVPPPAVGQPAPCTMADITLDLTIEKKTYRPGEIVRASAAVARPVGATCAIPLFTEFQILNSAGKNILRDGPQTETVMNYSSGADGGPAFDKSSFSWEAVDCTPQRLSGIVTAPGDRTGCIAFPTGTYTVVPVWSDSSLSARVTFELTI